MPEHLQLGPVKRLIAELDSLLGAAISNREMDLVISYAFALDALQRTLNLLRERRSN